MANHRGPSPAQSELPAEISALAGELARRDPEQLLAVYAMNDRCVWASPSHETMLGYPLVETLGQHWKKFVAPADHGHSVLAGDDALLHGESIEFHVSAVTKDGAMVPLRAKAWIVPAEEPWKALLFFQAQRTGR